MEVGSISTPISTKHRNDFQPIAPESVPPISMSSRSPYMSQDIDTAPDTDAVDEDEEAVQQQLEQDELEQTPRSVGNVAFQDLGDVAQTMLSFLGIDVSSSRAESAAPVAVMGSTRESNGVSVQEQPVEATPTPHPSKKRPSPTETEDDDEDVLEGPRRTKRIRRPVEERLEDDVHHAQPTTTPAQPKKTAMVTIRIPVAEATPTALENGASTSNNTPLLSKNGTVLRGAAARSKALKLAGGGKPVKAKTVRPPKPRNTPRSRAEAFRATADIIRAEAEAEAEQVQQAFASLARQRARNSPEVLVDAPPPYNQSNNQRGKTADRKKASATGKANATNTVSRRGKGSASRAPESAPSESESESSNDPYSDSASEAAVSPPRTNTRRRAASDSRDKTRSAAPTRATASRPTRRQASKRVMEALEDESDESAGSEDEDDDDREEIPHNPQSTSASTASRGKARSNGRRAGKQRAAAVEVDQILATLFSLARTWSKKYSKYLLQHKLAMKAKNQISAFRDSVDSGKSQKATEQRLQELWKTCLSIISAELNHGERKRNISEWSRTRLEDNQSQCMMLADIHKALIPQVLLALEDVSAVDGFSTDAESINLALELAGMARKLSKPELASREPMSSAVAEIMGNKLEHLQSSLVEACRHLEDLLKAVSPDKEDESEEARLQRLEEEQLIADLDREIKLRARARTDMINKRIYEQITLQDYKARIAFTEQLVAHRASQRLPSSSPLSISDDTADEEDENHFFNNEDMDMGMMDDEEEGPPNDESPMSDVDAQNGDYFQRPGENFERLGMPGFGSRSEEPKKSAGPWRDDELTALVEGLEKYQGTDRYPKILDEWGKQGGPLAERDMDEIFEQAKEIKAALVRSGANDGIPVEDWLMSV